jgi:hypothetical protein
MSLSSTPRNLVPIFLVFVAASLIAPAAEAQLTLPPFTMEEGNAALEIIPAVIPVIYHDVSPHANDATVVLRVTSMITNGWFDAIAPYHATAKGVYSNLGRRPPVERTTYNKNIAMFYASYRILTSLFPHRHQLWRDLLSSHGLDPDDARTSKTSPIGIGNAAGFAVAAAREQDGMNQLGNEGGCEYNCQPYADYLGYEPVNTAYELEDASRWQPAITTTGAGLFRVQQFVTPQLRVTLPYSYDDPDQFESPEPVNSNPYFNPSGYAAQADEVLSVSANLTDAQKMLAERFDNKLESLGFSALFILLSREQTIDEFVQYDFLTNMAAFDTAIAIWNQKHRWDAVRPFSAIEYIYGDQHVTAWGGPGKGTVSNLPAGQWTSYLAVADHPEYPSGSASFCAAHAEASRLYLGSDALGWSITFPKGSSRIEPGVTPASDLTVTWNTWTEFAEDCGMSRLWGGVHFFDSIPAGHAIGHEIGGLAYEFLQKHVSGNLSD